MSNIFLPEFHIYIVSNSFLRKLRICIVILSFISGVILTAWYGYVIDFLVGTRDPITLSGRAICEIVIIIVIFLTYTYAVRSKNTFIHKKFRAFVLLGIAALWLCIAISLLAIRGRDKANTWRSDEYSSGMDRAIETFSVLCGVLVLLEVAVTLKHGPLEHGSGESLKPQQHEMVIVNPTQPIQPQYPQPYPNQYYPQQSYPMTQQQHSLQEQQYQPKFEMEDQYQPKFEIQDQLYQAQQQQQQQQPLQMHQSFDKPLPQQPQQQYYLPRPYSANSYSGAAPQQLSGSMVTTTLRPYSANSYSGAAPQQAPGSMVTTTPRPYSANSYSAAAPQQVPGSMVTTTPQPGTSVAVPPVLSMKKYSSPQSRIPQ
ncbi:hypothetical protein BG000_001920 [Podila horticola]|nr:hypothetical protein BG000_001920 [Podila horticola]